MGKVKKEIIESLKDFRFDALSLRLFLLLVVCAWGGYYWSIQSDCIVKTLSDGYNVTEKDYYCWLGVSVRDTSIVWMLYWVCKTYVPEYARSKRMCVSFISGLLWVFLSKVFMDFQMIYAPDYIDLIYCGVLCISAVATYCFYDYDFKGMIQEEIIDLKIWLKKFYLMRRK